MHQKTPYMYSVWTHPQSSSVILTHTHPSSPILTHPHSSSPTLTHTLLLHSAYPMSHPLLSYPTPHPLCLIPYVSSSPILTHPHLSSPIFTHPHPSSLSFPQRDAPEGEGLRVKIVSDKAIVGTLLNALDVVSLCSIVHTTALLSLLAKATRTNVQLLEVLFFPTLFTLFSPFFRFFFCDHLFILLYSFSFFFTLFRTYLLFFVLFNSLVII